MSFRRTIGLGAAALLAVLSAVISAGQAGAATTEPTKFTTWGVHCFGGQLNVYVSLENYVTDQDNGNSVEVTDQSGKVFVPLTHFSDPEIDEFGPFPGDQSYTLTMTVHAVDDPGDVHGGHGTPTMNQYDGTFTATFGPCAKDGYIEGNGPQPAWTTTCDSAGQVTVALKLRRYLDMSEVFATNNTVVVTDSAGHVVIPPHQFAVSDTTMSQPMDGTEAHDFQMTINAKGDSEQRHGDGTPDQYSGTFRLSSKPCQKTVSSTTAQPPATTTARPVPAPAGSSGGPLPNTGVNVSLPLLVAGSLVALGGAVLLGLRRSARRRTE